MKNNLNLWLFLFFFIALPGVINLQAQTPCYTQIRSRGLQYLQQGQYFLAVEQFWTAHTTCEDKPEKNDLFELIKKAQQSQITVLEKIIKKEQIALQAADSARIVAIEAKKLEVEARNQAEENAKKAREQGRIAESLRLSLLADMARERGALAEAMQLSLLSLYLSDKSPAALRAYGATVRDSLSRQLLHTSSTLKWIGQPLSSGQILAKTATQELYLLNPATGTNTLLSAKKRELLQLVRSASGHYFLSWSENEPAQLWNANGAALTRLKTQAQSLRSVAFSSNDSLIVTGGRDHVVRIWSLNGEQLLEHRQHTGNIYEVFFSPDNSTVFSRSSDGLVFEWNLLSNQVNSLGDKKVYLYDVAFQNDSPTLIAAAAADGTALTWRQQGNQHSEIALSKGDALLEISFCPRSAIMLARTASGKTFIYDLEKEMLKKLLSTDSVIGTCWSPDGKQLISWSDSPDILLWTREGDFLAPIPGISGGTVSAVFSEDGEYILLNGYNGVTKLLNLQGEIQMEWPADRNRQACLLPDGKNILISSGSNLSVCPLPAFVLNRSSMLPDKNAAGALINKYNIQLFQE